MQNKQSQILLSALRLPKLTRMSKQVHHVGVCLSLFLITPLSQPKKFCARRRRGDWSHFSHPFFLATLIRCVFSVAGDSEKDNRAGGVKLPFSCQIFLPLFVKVPTVSFFLQSHATCFLLLRRLKFRSLNILKIASEQRPPALTDCIITSTIIKPT